MGATEGVLVGDQEGLFDGQFDGLTVVVGEEEGDTDGAPGVGAIVGSIVGIQDSDADGTDEDWAVGLCDGRMVGMALGATASICDDSDGCWELDADGLVDSGVDGITEGLLDRARL